MPSQTPLTYRRVLALTWPVVLAQAATALTGVVDTAVMGRVGDMNDLAAVGVAAMIFTFVYWAFGFLRMSTTGLVAQSQGANDGAQARAYLVRGLLTGAVLGVVVLVAAWPIEYVALTLFDAAAAVEALASEYFWARIVGAPAALMGYVVTGYLIGSGQTRRLLAFQVVLSGVNIGLDVWFAGVLGWGPAGIGLGTALAEWLSLGFGLWWVRDGLRRPAKLFDREKLRALFAANRDILIRTLALLFSFAWLVDSGAQVSTAALAGNEVLLQFVAVAAFVLDAFAYTSEKEVGEAIGQRSQQALRRAMRVTSTLSLGFGAALAAVFFVGGDAVIELFIRDVRAAEVARTYLPYAAAVPLIGVPAWQLDGAFLGATRGRELRNAAVMAAVAYIAVDSLLTPRWGNTGVWIALLWMYVARALALLLYWPRLVAAAQKPAGEGTPAG